jgi:hypothetical protein
MAMAYRFILIIVFFDLKASAMQTNSGDSTSPVITLDELGAAGKPIFKSSPTMNYCSDKLGDPRWWHLKSLHF